MTVGTVRSTRNAWRVLAAGTLVLFACACTRSVKVTEPYARLDPDEGIAYVVETTDGRTVTTDLFARMDSTFVIHAVIEEGRRRDVDPIVIRFDDIASISRVEISGTRTALAAGVAVGLLAALVYAIANSFAAPGN